MDLGKRTLRLSALGIFAVLAPVGCHRKSTGTIPGTPVLSTIAFNSRKVIPVGTGATSIVSRDFDDDGLDDMLVTRFQDGLVTLLRTHFDGSNPTPVNLPAGPLLPAGVASADLDDDDRPDVLVTDGGSNQFFTYRNLGGGTFELIGPTATSNDPFALTIADWDGDGILDVAIGGLTARDIRIHRGLGEMSFDAGTSIEIPFGIPVALNTQDLDDDGRPDLIVADYSLSLLRLWRNTTSTGKEGGGGTISFDTTPETPTPPLPFGVAVADVNHNGKVDLAVSSFGFPAIQVFEQDNFTLTSLALIPLPSVSSGIAIGDVNGDGKLDIAASLAADDGVAISLGDGAGNFAAPVVRSASRGPLFVALGDINHDGRDDVLVAGALDGEISVFSGKSTGAVDGPPSFFGGFAPRLLSAGDLNGDGKPDLAIGDEATGQVRVFGNGGSLAFTGAATLTTSTSARRAVLVETSGDGKLDIAALHADGLTLFHNDGAFGFTPSASFAAGSSLLDGVAVDLTGDGKADVVASDPDNAQVLVFKNNGAGLEFLFAVAAGDGAAGLDVADLDNDGDLDVSVANNIAGTVSVARQNANGTFAANALVLPTTARPAFVRAGDIEGDGRRDLVVSHGQGTALERFKNLGGFTFAAPDAIVTNGTALGLALTDLNHDGRADLLYTESEGGVACVRLGKADGSFAPKSLTMPSQYFIGDLLLADLDGDNKPELVTSSQVSTLITVHKNQSH